VIVDEPEMFRPPKPRAVIRYCDRQPKLPPANRDLTRLSSTIKSSPPPEFSFIILSIKAFLALISRSRTSFYNSENRFAGKKR
jgi:hypothetical protein